MPDFCTQVIHLPYEEIAANSKVLSFLILHLGERGGRGAGEERGVLHSLELTICQHQRWDLRQQARWHHTTMIMVSCDVNVTIDTVLEWPELPCNPGLRGFNALTDFSSSMSDSGAC